MEQEVFEHLSRITTICDGLARHPAWDDKQQRVAFDRLSAFDHDFWTFTRYLSLPLYEETNALLHQGDLSILDPPTIAVVMALHRPEPPLLTLAIRSALESVGVRVHLHLSLDGPEGNLPLVEDVLAALAVDRQQVSVHLHPQNRGVGLCRNAALELMQQEWFTFLDCDDIFHPLRLLHAWLETTRHHITFLNTSYSRVSLRQRKIVLLQQGLSSIGGNSFFANRSVLTNYGYLAPLRFWEDSEYQQRLRHFALPMLSSRVIGHYQNTDLAPGYQSLATRWRKEAYSIEGHPWLCGTVLGDIDVETDTIRSHFLALYPRLRAEQLAKVFPPEGAPMGMVSTPPQG